MPIAYSRNNTLTPATTYAVAQVESLNISTPYSDEEPDSVLIRVRYYDNDKGRVGERVVKVSLADLATQYPAFAEVYKSVKGMAYAEAQRQGLLPTGGVVS